jgi:RNA polymerase sigma-70 factor (ECF subfamily)
VEQREVFWLRMQGGLSFKEIAKVQKCSINTALARMQYALSKLRNELGDEYRELQEAG